ncbi:MAG: DedA family protein [Acidobacteria bacterium]|nr:DedA family protein [Acidobacteriota bacterium]MBV9437596.1 DedA family protein [Acidobacteriota bacterium]
MTSLMFELLRRYFAEYGYWTVAVVLLLENAGIPVPGETTLLFAAFLAFSEHHLTLLGIILIGVIACTLGDNAGYWIGYHGGRPLLEHQRRIFRISDENLHRGESFFARYGSFTVFFARFVFGMRILAGPMAGVLKMPWKKFVLFNFLGAVLWVSVIASLGYFFGTHWDWLTSQIEIVEVALGAGLLIAVAVWWRQRNRMPARRSARAE